MIKLTVTVSALLLAVPAASQDVLLATDEGTGVKVYAHTTPDTLHLKTVGPANVSIGYDMDVNNNGVLDPRVDREYGFTSDGGFCPQFSLSETSSTFCGGAPSVGKGDVQKIGETRVTQMQIPIAEATNDPDQFRITLRFWNEATKKSTKKKVRYVLEDATIPPAGSAALGGILLPSTVPGQRAVAPRVDTGFLTGRWTGEQGKCATSWIEFTADKRFKTGAGYKGMVILKDGQLTALDDEILQYVIDGPVSATDRDTLVIGGNQMFRCL